MKKIKEFLYDLWSRFLVQFSKIKVLTFNFLPILAYDPEPYVVTGDDVLQIMEFIQPGDVLLRGYDKYLDGKFIPDEKGYSHAGIYCGNNEVIHAMNPSVQRINIIDFCQADRVMVLRPNGGQDEALKKAESLIGVPYDFNYESDEGKLYCFELVANVYPQADMKIYTVKQLCGLVKKDCYLAKSIYGNGFFKMMFERNEK